MISLRDAMPEDHPVIATLVRDAFDSKEHAALVERLRASAHAIVGGEVVAERDGDVVGHVMLTTVPVGETLLPTLSPLSVLPRHQGTGIGSALVREVLARAEAMGAAAVLVEGDPGYYGRFGFEGASAHGIIPPPGVPDWALQVVVLGPRVPAGRVRYPPAFDVVASVPPG